VSRQCPVALPLAATLDDPAAHASNRCDPEHPVNVFIGDGLCQLHRHRQ
jgi:hypothetical protein